MLDHESRGYLAAMIDAEGTVQLGNASAKGRKGYTRLVVIYNTDRAIIDHTCECLDGLGISYSLYLQEPKGFGTKKLYRITVSGRENLRKLIPLPIQSEKLDKLVEIQASYREVAA